MEAYYGDTSYDAPESHAGVSSGTSEVPSASAAGLREPRAEPAMRIANSAIMGIAFSHSIALALTGIGISAGLPPLALAPLLLATFGTALCVSRYAHRYIELQMRQTLGLDPHETPPETLPPRELLTDEPAANKLVTRIEAGLESLRRRRAPDDTVRSISQICLPRIVGAYNQIESEHRSLPVVDGLTPREELVTQLRVVAEQVDDLLARPAAEKIDAMRANRGFLATRFRN